MHAHARTHVHTHTHTHTQNHAWYLGMSVSQQKVAGTFVDDRQVPNELKQKP